MLSPARLRASFASITVFWAIILLGVAADEIADSKSVTVNASRILSFRPVSLSADRFLSDNCVCVSNVECSCCARFLPGGIFNLRDLCLDWIIIPAEAAINVTLSNNNGTIIANTFSVNDMPPICFPILPQISLMGCIKLHSIGLVDDKIHICANASMAILINTFINFQLGCMDFNAGGIVLSNRTDIRPLGLTFDAEYHKKIVQDFTKTAADVQQGAADIWSMLTNQTLKLTKSGQHVHKEVLHGWSKLANHSTKTAQEMHKGVSEGWSKLRNQTVKLTADATNMQKDAVNMWSKFSNATAKNTADMQTAALQKWSQFSNKTQKTAENMQRGLFDGWDRFASQTAKAGQDVQQGFVNGWSKLVNQTNAAREHVEQGFANLAKSGANLQKDVLDKWGKFTEQTVKSEVIEDFMPQTSEENLSKTTNAVDRGFGNIFEELKRRKFI